MATGSRELPFRTPCVSPEVLAERLGHASPTMTLSIYAHVFEQDDKAAAELVASVNLGAWER